MFRYLQLFLCRRWMEDVGDWGDVRVTGLLVSAAAWEDCADSGLFDPRHNTAAIICKHFAQPGRCLPGPGESPHFCSWWRQRRILLLLSLSSFGGRVPVFLRIIQWTCKTSLLKMINNTTIWLEDISVKKDILLDAFYTVIIKVLKVVWNCR